MQLLQYMLYMCLILKSNQSFENNREFFFRSVKPSLQYQALTPGFAMFKTDQTQ